LEVNEIVLKTLSIISKLQEVAMLNRGGDIIHVNKNKMVAPQKPQTDFRKIINK